MKTDAKLEPEYRRIIQKDKIFWTEAENKAEDERISLAADQFEFDEKNINILEQLNLKMLQEEKRIFPFYKRIVEENEKLVQNNIIDDFNIVLIISCYSNHYENLDPELEYSCFSETECHFMNHQKQKTYFEDDWREHGVRYPLSHFAHCYSFHHLYDHTNLSFFDLCLITNIWFEIKVDYQFFTKNPIEK